MAKLKNEYLTSYEEWFLSGIYYCIIMEYCENGDLRSRINEKKSLKKFFNLELIYNWINEIINGIYYLHNKQRIIHRDIKPNNIFLTNKARIKIGDFGISRVFDDESTSIASTHLGTHKYMSPQVLNNSDYTFKTDCWSIGCTLYELITLNIFYDSVHYVSIDKINESNISSMNILNQLLNMMLQVDEHKRSSSQQLMNKIKEQSKFIFDRVLYLHIISTICLLCSFFY